MKRIRLVRHGLLMGMLALLCGELWAVYLATHHEQLHGDFERQSALMSQIMEPHDHADDMMHGHDMDSMLQGQHSHSGSLATDAMQRLLRGHIHFMGIGMLVIIMLLLVAASSLKSIWKRLLGWSFGLGALLYPPAWILMGLRTVELGPQGAEASVLWLFGPAVALLIGSTLAVLALLIIEMAGWGRSRWLAWAFDS